jgi:CRP-like cAMP-binding protein
VSEPALDALASAGFLTGVPRDELDLVLARGDRVAYIPGERIFGELEPRDTIVVILSGKVRVSVAAGESGETVLAELGPGTPLGEVGLLTGRVASATVTAIEVTEVLHLPREVVSELMVRFPQVARAFARMLGARIAETDRALERALAGHVEPVAGPELLGGDRPGLARSLLAAFRDAVLQHRSELPFFFLSGFVSALLTSRMAVRLGHLSAHGFRDLYVVGLFLLILTGASAHFIFERSARRILSAAYGVALGFLANELSVLLSFDVFYLDMKTVDPDATFAYRDLYDRAPSRWAALLIIAVAIQATYMRGFYRRAFFLVRARLRRKKA